MKNLFFIFAALGAFFVFGSFSSLLIGPWAIIIGPLLSPVLEESLKLQLIIKYNAGYLGAFLVGLLFGICELVSKLVNLDGIIISKSSISLSHKIIPFLIISPIAIHILLSVLSLSLLSRYRSTNVFVSVVVIHYVINLLRAISLVNGNMNYITLDTFVASGATCILIYFGQRNKLA